MWLSVQRAWDIIAMRFELDGGAGELREDSIKAPGRVTITRCAIAALPLRHKKCLPVCK
jgi:hypothetical protein